MNSAERLYRKQKRKMSRFVEVRARAAGREAIDAVLGEGAGDANALGLDAYEETRARDQMHIRKGGHALRFRLGFKVADGVRWAQCIACLEVFHALTGDIPPECPTCGKEGTVGAQGFICPVHEWHDASHPCEDYLFSQVPAVKVQGSAVPIG